MESNFDIHEWQANYLRKSLKENTQVLKRFTFGYDIENIEQVEDYIQDTYREGIDYEIHIERGDDVMGALDVLNRNMLQDRELLQLIRNCKGRGSFRTK